MSTSEGKYMNMTEEKEPETVSQQMRRIAIIIGHVNKLGPAEKSYLRALLNQKILKGY